jgi:hypothetical protein
MRGCDFQNRLCGGAFCGSRLKHTDFYFDQPVRACIRIEVLQSRETRVVGWAVARCDANQQSRQCTNNNSNHRIKFNEFQSLFFVEPLCIQPVTKNSYVGSMEYVKFKELNFTLAVYLSSNNSLNDQIQASQKTRANK